MMKYLKFLLLFSKYSFIRTAMFKTDFWLKFFMDIAYYGVMILIILVIYSHVDTIKGWSRQEFFLLLSLFFLIDSLYMVFVSTNSWNVSRLVNTGQFDYYLTKPINPFFFTFFNSVEISSGLNFVVTVPFAVYSIYSVDLTSLQIAGYFLVLVTGSVVFFCLRALTAMAVFWSQSPFPAERLWLSLYDYMQSPRNIYPLALRFAFTLLVPIFFIASIPAEAVIKSSLSLFAGCILVSSVLALITAFVWRHALLNYRSASS